MNKKVLKLIVPIGIACFLLLGLSAALTANAEDAKKPPASCLECHGPYEKVMEKTKDYKLMSGQEEITGNPHMYVPHESKDIPTCTYCHDAHPVPLTTKEGLPKPTYTWCYGCHHTKDLTCGNCH